MKFYTFGKKSHPAIVMIHGMFTPWTVWKDIADRFQEKYYIIIPALDGHDGTQESFIALENEAIKIENYLAENNIIEVKAIFGLSMGGAIANLLWKNRKVKAEHIIMDGAPLVPSGFAVKTSMTLANTGLLKKSKARDPKVIRSFKTDFLPEKFLEDYLAIADTMEEDTVKRISASVCESTIAEGLPESTEILYLHGTKANEAISKKSAAALKELYPKAEVQCIDGMGHAELLAFDPQRWADIAEKFIEW